MKTMKGTLTIGIDKLAPLLEVMIEKKQPVMVWGAPGIGKSAVQKQTSEKVAKNRKLKFTDDWLNNLNDLAYYNYVDLRLSQFDPTDIKGVPTLNGTWIPPNWFPKQGQGVIFLDEMNLASHSVQASAYQLVNDREICGHKLPDGYSIVMAGNRGKKDGARVTEMVFPLANRMAHLEIEEAITWAKVWLNWATDNGINQDIVAFLTNNPSKIWEYSPQTDPREGLTPRSWEKASRLIEGVTDLKLIKDLVATVCNVPVAVAFVAFIKLRGKVDIKAIIAGKQDLPTEVDAKYSVVAGLVGHIKATPKDAEKIIKLPMWDKHREFWLYLLRQLPFLPEQQKDSNTGLHKELMKLLKDKQITGAINGLHK